MEQIEDNKLTVVIAAKQFIYRLGVKTIVSVIGVEPTFVELTSYENILQYLCQYPFTKYVVMYEDIVPSPKELHLKRMEDLCPFCKFMLIGGCRKISCSCVRNIGDVESQKELVEKFQEFFFEPEKECGEEKSVLLSDREIDVLKAVAKGFSNKEIADVLCISANTVITHRKNITEKLGIKTIAGLTVYALLNNIINPDEVKM